MESGYPVIREVVYVSPQVNWSFPLHKHEEAAELSLIIGGRGTFYCGGEHRRVEKGMLVLKNPGLSHSEKSDGEDPLEQICIEAENIRAQGLPENCVVPPGADPVVPAGEDFAFLRACFEFIMHNSERPGFEQLCGKVLDAAIELIRRRSAPEAEKRPAKGEAELIPAVLEYIDAHYHEKIVIKDLAAAFYVSEGNLSRRFKKHTGFTINNYIVSKRMGEAQRMLIFEDGDIKDIARRCGYEDIQYFYHVFKSCAHCAPAEFRRRYKTALQKRTVNASERAE